MSRPAYQVQTPPMQQTIGEDFETYCNMRRQRSPRAYALYSSVHSRLRTEPVTEVDVQAIWSKFSCSCWIDAVLYNIVRFDILNTQPAGGYIELFIETEMLQYNDEGVEAIITMYEQHKRASLEAANSPRVGRFHRAIRSFTRIGLK
ncbi:hypothetical protein G6011_04273 [Alternaria panax]|uniref:Uncharacterized protein n=1 Tax=Alternaria panax TaxID=48097 RepID=A0AAD4IG83_9PLEO|nr:hypothetical protein G6011_04273 [Alternaria panax]